MHDPLQSFFSLLVASWLFAAAVLAVKRLRQLRDPSIHLVICAHFLLCGLPLFLDVLVGQPEYSRFRGLILAVEDAATTWCYLAYVRACPVIWFLCGTRYTTSHWSLRVNTSSLRSLHAVCYPVALSPLVAVFLSPSPDQYLNYAVPIGGFASVAAGEWHHLLSLLCVFSVLASAFLLSESRRLTLALCTFVGSTTVASCWLHGKRTIVAIVFVLFGWALWRRGVLRGRRLVAASLIGACVILGFSLWYQRAIRNPDVTGWAGTDSAYDGSRLDFFRDDRIKMTLFALLHPEELRVLEYPGQSFLFHATFFVPRAIWNDKPWPYATYFTSAALEIYPARPLGWGMTTSWLEEPIANLGWAGLILAPLSLALFCRSGDAANWAPMTMLTSLLAVLLMMVEMTAFMALFALWFGFWVFLKLERRAVSSSSPVAQSSVVGPETR